MTIMTSHHQFFLVSIVIAALFSHLLSQASSSHNRHQQKHSPTSPRVLLFEEKTRLGSTPPSCHNKCNGCHPCMAVQVPTIPIHNRVQPVEFLDPYPSGNRYSNYKPLGWKCRCDGHLYNP